MDSDLLRTINWKTTALAAGFCICKIVGWVWPETHSYCDVFEAVIISGGLLSAADAARVQNIVQAVDGILGINKVTPAVISTAEVPTLKG